MSIKFCSRRRQDEKDSQGSSSSKLMKSEDSITEDKQHPFPLITREFLDIFG